MLGTQESVFHFGDFEIREREFRLIKAGEVVPVEPKAFRVLLFLLHNPQKLITKEELLNAVWRETAVSENSLTRSVALLRKLLGDDTHQARYIETVATVGYRFVCPVEVVDGANDGLAAVEDRRPEPLPGYEEVATAAVPPEVRDKASSAPMRKWVLAAAVAAVVLLASAIWYLRRPLPKLRVTEYAQITHDGQMKFVLGTDGSRIYFHPVHGGPIAQVAIAGGEIVPVRPLPPMDFVDLSPDGSTWLGVTVENGESVLWAVQVPGGTSRRLATVAPVSSAAWSPDGKAVAFRTIRGDVSVLRLDGSAPQRILNPENPSETNLILDVAWSPDGSRIRFTRAQKFWEISANGKGLHQLLPNWQPSAWQCCGHWTPDGRFFVFLLQETYFFPDLAGNQLWVLDERHQPGKRPSAEPVQLTSGPIRWGTPILSKDGKKIFARGVILNGQSVRYDAQSHQLQPYLGGISAEFFSFSRDRRFVAYVTFPDGILWRANVDGSNPLRLTDPPLYPINPRWSPDGTQLLFGTLSSNGSYINYTVPSQGGTPQPLLPEDKSSQGDPYWSPDGHKVVFNSVHNGDLRVLDLATHQVSIVPGSNGRWSPRWSPDGRNIVALDVADHSLRLFDIETRKWSLLQSAECEFPAWSSDARFVYCLRGSGVYRTRVADGVSEQVIDLTGFRSTGAFAGWMGLDPDDAPLLVRDLGNDDIYALTLEEK